MIENIRDMLRTVLAYREVSGLELPLESSLYETGIGLDSLDTAAFSSMLEAEFGIDPYSAGDFPETLADVLSFYEERTPQSV